MRWDHWTGNRRQQHHSLNTTRETNFLAFLLVRPLAFMQQISPGILSCCVSLLPSQHSFSCLRFFFFCFCCMHPFLPQNTPISMSHYRDNTWHKVHSLGMNSECRLPGNVASRLLCLGLESLTKMIWIGSAAIALTWIVCYRQDFISKYLSKVKLQGRKLNWCNEAMQIRSWKLRNTARQGWTHAGVQIH